MFIFMITGYQNPIRRNFQKMETGPTKRALECNEEGEGKKLKIAFERATEQSVGMRCFLNSFPGFKGKIKTKYPFKLTIQFPLLHSFTLLYI